MNRKNIVIIFDAKDANPNGDPDAGNLPRIDPETNHGLVTDVCLKRKIRNFVALLGQEVYYRDGAVLANVNTEAYAAVGETPGEKVNGKVKEYLLKRYYDNRTFGYVGSSKTANGGKVTGPVSFGFARSIDPIFAQEFCITRTSVATEDRIGSDGLTHEMGRKSQVPYGLYVAQGFVNPFLAEKTGFSEADYEILLKALENLFEFDRASARPAGSMAVRGLLVFEHETPLGNARSEQLFELVSINRANGNGKAPRSFADYEVKIDESKLPKGVKLIRRIDPEKASSEVV
jgi:CRISPR-associated protein Csd2